MRPTRLLVSTLFLATLAAPSAFACGEGIFSMGDALRYDGYLAPRPATVLVYEPDGDASPERIAVYRGLARAGHRLTVVSDAGRLPEVLAGQSFDIVVADDEHSPALASALPIDAGTRRLLVMSGKPPRGNAASGLAIVRGTASLGTWLGALNKLMKD